MKGEKGLNDSEYRRIKGLTKRKQMERWGFVITMLILVLGAIGDFWRVGIIAEKYNLNGALEIANSAIDPLYEPESPCMGYQLVIYKHLFLGIIKIACALATIGVWHLRRKDQTLIEKLWKMANITVNEEDVQENGKTVDGGKKSEKEKKR
jgi:hypothetical protein